MTAKVQGRSTAFHKFGDVLMLGEARQGRHKVAQRDNAGSEMAFGVRSPAQGDIRCILPVMPPRTGLATLRFRSPSPRLHRGLTMTALTGLANAVTDTLPYL
jgi:hypothetical protein